QIDLRRAVAALVKEVVGRLTSELIKEFRLFRGFKNDILSLKEEFTQNEAVLEDAEEKQNKDKAVQVWLKSLKSATMEAENVLDEISTRSLLQRLHKEMEIERGIKYKVRALFSKVMFRVKAAHKVKAIRAKLDDIASVRRNLGLNPGDSVDEDSAGEMPNRETSSLVIRDSASIFGRDEEREMVVENICNNGIGKYDNGEILVYGIWGMGGIGKTTLAQLVYDHENVKQNFPLRCWVYVSENFEVNEIIKKIIESVDGCECTLTQLDTLQVKLQDRLTGKKFLIVLDDIWIEDKEKAKWDELSKTLSCGEEGSIVVMTTRSRTTSQMMAKVGKLQHELECLSEDNSWLLFSKFAFAQGREGDDIGVLEPIGREIVEKCKGLPLALKTLGSLMWLKKSTSDWEHMKGSIIWEFQENGVLPALKLSYEMEKDELIHLWVVNGFIPPIEGKALYMFGEEILNYLVWRSFFQLVDTKNHLRNDPYIYKMHDLIHDLALHVMGDDCLVIESTVLPESVIHLQNLQVLILSHCYRLAELPEGLRHMVNLQCLDISDSYALRRLPVGIKELNRLRILSEFPIVKEDGARIGELGDLVLLEGMLEIIGLENVEGFSEAKSANLKCKTNLSILKLRWNSPESILGGYKCDEKEVLEGLEPNPGLKVLEIFCYMDKIISPSWMANLKNLIKITFYYCKKCERIPPLGRFPNLRVIILYRMDCLKGFHEDDTNMSGDNPNIFPSLQTLDIIECHSLVSLPSILPKLKVLKLSRCDQLVSLWDEILKNLNKLYVYRCKHLIKRYKQEIGEDWPKVSHIPDVEIVPAPSYDEDEDDVDDVEFVPAPSYDEDKDDVDNEDEDGDNPNIFPSLQTLRIEYCRSLVSLPSNLPKLGDLQLDSCNVLVSLPEEILKDLNKLHIIECKHLTKRYKHGQDWPKFSHIPDVKFIYYGRVVQL
ncbi:hypothetical protein M8C21_001366, partial [Ambrosia artemisiifolia]